MKSFCDLDLRNCDLENLISLSVGCGKYLCKFWFKCLQWFKSYSIHKISMDVAA